MLILGYWDDTYHEPVTVSSLSSGQTMMCYKVRNLLELQKGLVDAGPSQNGCVCVSVIDLVGGLLALVIRTITVQSITKQCILIVGCS